MESKLQYRLRSQARDKFNKLAENEQLLYSTEQCQMCGAHLTIRQLNRVILDGVPPVCLKCYKKMEGDIEKLAPLFEQLSLI